MFFSFIMILFYQDEAQEKKFQIFLSSMNVRTEQTNFQVNSMVGSYETNIFL